MAEIETPISELVKLRIIGKDRNEPMWMGTVARSPDLFDLEPWANHNISLNAIHGVEYIGAMADVHKAEIMASAIADGYRYQMPAVYSSIIAVNQKSLKRNVYIGQPLTAESVVIGRHRPYGIDDNIEYAMSTDSIRGDNTIEARRISRLIKRLIPNSTTSNHGATFDMAEYAEVLPGEGNEGYCDSISAILGPAHTLQQFSLDLPSEIPFAPGVFPAAGAIGNIDGYKNTMANFLRENTFLRYYPSKMLRGNYAVNEVLLLRAVPRQRVTSFDPSVVVRMGTQRIVRLLEPFASQLDSLPYNTSDSAHTAARNWFRGLLEDDDPSWEKFIPVPAPDRARNLQQEHFALNDRRYFLAIMALGDFVAIAQQHQRTELCLDLIESVRRALRELHKTTAIVPRCIADATAKYVELGFANMTGNLAMSTLDFGPDVDQRFEQLSTYPRHPEWGMALA